MKVVGPSLLLVLATVVAHATGPAAPRTPLPAADCIDTTRINEWHIVDARTAIVRTGPKHYLVILQTACPQLNHPPGLIFDASPSSNMTNRGRICGDAGETVHSRNQAPCAIASVSQIDKARFKQLSVPTKRHDEASQPTAIQPTH